MPTPDASFGIRDVNTTIVQATPVATRSRCIVVPIHIAALSYAPKPSSNHEGRDCSG